MIALSNNITTESDPGFENPDMDIYYLTAGSRAIGAAGSLSDAASAHPVLWEYTPTEGKKPRTSTDDLGALDYDGG